MRVLLVDGYDPNDEGRLVVATAIETLRNSGHVVVSLAAVTDGFSKPMSEAERVAYHDEGSNLLAEEVSSAAKELLAADAVLFCYPTITFTVPAAIKNWFDRVLVPGVAFTIDSEGTLRPTLKHLVRIGAITTSPHGGSATRAARDGGRRLLKRNLRLHCGLICRRTFLRLPADNVDANKITKVLSSW